MAACSLAVNTDGLSGGGSGDSGTADGTSSPADAGDETSPARQDGAPGSDAGSLHETGTLDSAAPEAAPPDSGEADGTSAADGASTPDAPSGSDATVQDSPLSDGPAQEASGPTPVDLAATKDVYVQDGTSANTNFDTDAQLIVKARSQTGLNRISWLTFDVSGYSNVSSARLRLYVGSLDSSSTVTIPLLVDYAPTASDPWDPAGITWNTQPPSGGMVASANVDDTAVGTWIEIDVTAAVAADTDGQSTFMITSTPVTNRGAIFSSTRGAEPPVLRITGMHP